MIREIRATDHPEIATLLLVIFADMELPFLQKYGREMTRAVLMRAMADPNYRYGNHRGIVVELHGEIAGVAFGYPAQDEPLIDTASEAAFRQLELDTQTTFFTDSETFANEWYLDSICVAQKFRGQGIGSKLLAAIEKLVTRDDEQILGLNVDYANPKAKKLYERQGFQVVGTKVISGHLYEHMQKKIA
ncbi:MAG: GNAT family N-acetyltransferase [Enterococcus sp.]